MISLFDDQEELLNKIRGLWPNNMRILTYALTGFGKTRLAARIIEQMTARGKRVCFTVPRTSLIDQTAEEFIDLGIEDITLLWGDYPTDESAKVVIASIDTYIRRKKGDFDLTIVDECHIRRIQMLEWMRDHPEDRYIGLTATPFPPWLGEYYTAMASGPKMRWLIDHDRLCDYEIFAPYVPDTKSVPVRESMEYGMDLVAGKELEDIMNGAKVVGNIVENWLEHGENRQTIVLPVNVAHANHIAIQFQRAGVTCEVITAKTPKHERNRIFDNVRAERTKVVISVNCLTEGFDIKIIACVINARPTKSKARYLQGMGRGLRKKPEGYRFQNCLIFDHSGTSIDLGYPEEIWVDSLPGGDDGLDKSDKAAADNPDKPEPKPKICPKCKYLKPAGVRECPKCGFVVLHGEDVETDESRGLVKVKGKQKEGPTPEQKRQFWEQLLGYQQQRASAGKIVSDGFLRHTYREKFGEWPNGFKNNPSEPGQEVLNFIKYKQIKRAKARAAT